MPNDLDWKRDRDLDAITTADPRPVRPAPGKATLTSRLMPVQRKAGAPVAAASEAAPEAAPRAVATPACDDPFALHLIGSGRAPANDAQVQFKVELSSEPANGNVHDAAERGFDGPGQTLPHLDEIQASFGAEHDVSGVKAHVGGAAGDACKEMGAVAYASGNQVAFGGAPDLHTAAHEAAHVVQQRAGVHLKGGVGQEGDPYEQHADAVADLVVAGQPAGHLLAGGGGGGGGDAVQRRVSLQTGPNVAPATIHQLNNLCAGRMTFSPGTVQYRLVEMMLDDAQNRVYDTARGPGAFLAAFVAESNEYAVNAKQFSDQGMAMQAHQNANDETTMIAATRVTRNVQNNGGVQQRNALMRRNQPNFAGHEKRYKHYRIWVETSGQAFDPQTPVDVQDQQTQDLERTLGEHEVELAVTGHAGPQSELVNRLLGLLPEGVFEHSDLERVELGAQPGMYSGSGSEYAEGAVRIFGAIMNLPRAAFIKTVCHELGHAFLEPYLHATEQYDTLSQAYETIANADQLHGVDVHPVIGDADQRIDYQASSFDEFVAEVFMQYVLDGTALKLHVDSQTNERVKQAWGKVYTALGQALGPRFDTVNTWRRLLS